MTTPDWLWTRGLLLAVALLAAGTPAAAQDAPAAPLSLAQALEIAEAKSEPVALAKLALTRNDGDAVRAKSGRRPQLSASASYERLLANEFQGVFDDIDFGGGQNGGDDDGSGGGLQNLPFGRAHTWRATLSFSQTLYAGGRLAAQDELVATARSAAEQGVTSARAQMLYDVTQAYYDAVLSVRLVTIAQATLDQADATLRQVQAGFDAGTQPEFEVLRARVNRDNQVPPLLRARVNRDLAELRLKQLLELPAERELRLTDALDDDRLPPPPPFAEQVSAAERNLPAAPGASLTLQTAGPLPDRNAVAEAETAVRQRESTLRAVQAERKPNVALTTNYSRIAFPSAFFPAFDRSNWAVGVSMNVPLLTGGRQRGDEMVARADIETARVQLRQVQELAALDTRSAWAELLAARATWEATAGTVQQAARAYEIAQVRYNAGLSTQLELSDARLLLQQAEANRAQAARDLQVARARAALLPNLPIGAAGGAAATAARGAGATTQAGQATAGRAAATARPTPGAPAQAGGAQTGAR